MRRRTRTAPSSLVLCALLAGACTDPADPRTAADDAGFPIAADRAGTVGEIVVVAPAGLALPESVAHDPVADLYIVSNLGDPFSAVLDGFISRLHPDGSIETLEWITGLISPAGLMIRDRTLYVVDRQAVHTYDLDTGDALETFPFPAGVSFLNDICGGPDGRLYVTDTGVAPSDDGFVSTGTAAVYRIWRGEVERFATLVGTAHPNGCLSQGAQNIIVTSFDGDGGIFRVNASGHTRQLVAMPSDAGLNDSAVLVRNRWVISSWGAAPFDVTDGDGVYLASRDGSRFTPLLPGFPSPGDIGHDQVRDRVLIPSVLGNVLAFVTMR